MEIFTMISFGLASYYLGVLNSRNRFNYPEENIVKLDCSGTTSQGMEIFNVQKRPKLDCELEVSNDSPAYDIDEKLKSLE